MAEFHEVRDVVSLQRECCEVDFVRGEGRYGAVVVDRVVFRELRAREVVDRPRLHVLHDDVKHGLAQLDLRQRVELQEDVEKLVPVHHVEAASELHQPLQTRLHVLPPVRDEGFQRARGHLARRCDGPVVLLLLLQVGKHGVEPRKVLRHDLEVHQHLLYLGGGLQRRAAHYEAEQVPQRLRDHLHRTGAGCSCSWSPCKRGRCEDCAGSRSRGADAETQEGQTGSVRTPTLRVRS
mmetsp:Transcript_15784/g.39080  ORF Transcript_15784/g.39080 Transcript_15784/m.39080 type:complete len:236 (-) Transcript_15784:798-1505(-)